MSLTELISGVEASEKTLIVHNADAEAVETVEAQFADRNVSVTAASTSPGPPEYVVLSEGDRVIAATSLSEVISDGESRTPAFARDPYEPILDELDETLFTSYDPRQMLAASREIEDRAWREGEGRLYAGFQRYSLLDAQLSAYEQLGTKPDLDVTAFAYPDAELSDHEETFAVFPDRAAEIRDTWFVVYDADDDASKCALLAEEREPRRFYGFWTYDPETVDFICSHLRSAYLDERPDTRRTTGR